MVISGLALMIIICSIWYLQRTEPSLKETPTVTLTSALSSPPTPTDTPTPTLTPTPDPGPVMRYVYINDKFSEQLSFEEFTSIPVWLHVKEEFDASIERVYLGTANHECDYPDEIQLLSESLYELADDNRSLYLPEAFFDYYKANDGVRIYLEFSNGEGDYFYSNYTLSVRQGICHEL